MPEEKIRAFIAIELAQEIKDYLRQLESDFKKTAADVKWVEPQNIHLTLKFLGEQDSKRIKAIKEILDKLANEKSRYNIELSHLGGFPKLETLRVIWIGLSAGDRETKELAAGLEERTCRLGIPKEKREFSSHITIGRVRSPLNREKLVAAIKNCAIPEGKLKFQVEDIALFKSTLTPQGPIYEAIHRAILTRPSSKITA